MYHFRVHLTWLHIMWPTLCMGHRGCLGCILLGYFTDRGYRSDYTWKFGWMSNCPQQFFLDNVIFYRVNELSMLISDAKFALLPCHFKSGAHHDFAKHYVVFWCKDVLTIKPEANYGNADDFNHFRTGCWWGCQVSTPNSPGDVQPLSE